MKVSEIIDRGGGPRELGRALGCNRTTVLGWRKADSIPLTRIPAIAKVLGVPKHELCPDYWDAPETPAPEQQAAA